MATAPERSKPLHNFSLPYLKWGSQKFLKCMKVSSNTNSSALDHPSALRESKSYQFRSRPVNSRGTNFTELSSPRKTSHYSKQKPSNANNDRAPGSSTMETMREKIIFDIREESKKLKFSIPEEGGEDESAAARPWNLRTRRAACKAPQEERKVELGSSSLKVITKESEREKERTTLSVPLSKEEVEEDFEAMVGTRPPRRPKKRPRVVQKQLESLFPGLWLQEVTLDSYKVADVPEA